MVANREAKGFVCTLEHDIKGCPTVIAVIDPAGETWPLCVINKGKTDGCEELGDELAKEIWVGLDHLYITGDQRDKRHSCAQPREVSFKSLETTARVLDKGLLFCSSERQCESKSPVAKDRSPIRSGWLHWWMRVSASLQMEELVWVPTGFLRSLSWCRTVEAKPSIFPKSKLFWGPPMSQAKPVQGMAPALR
jgi:hypothetical protein